MDVDGYNGTELANVDNKNSALLSQNLSLAESMDYLEGERKKMQREKDYKVDIIGTSVTLEKGKEAFESKANVTTTKKSTIKDEDDDEDDDETNGRTVILFGVDSYKKDSMVAFLITIWILLGMAGLVASIVCFGFSGSLMEKLIGILFAIVGGPFYWVYFIYNRNYCGRQTRRNRR
jgi:hypothetical protein